MSDAIHTRIGEISALINLMQLWPTLRPELERQKLDLVNSLVMQENEEVRGRIKQINDFMDLPSALNQELRGLQEALPD